VIPKPQDCTRRLRRSIDGRTAIDAPAIGA
jgi:hypothetical protein